MRKSVSLSQPKTLAKVESEATILRLHPKRSREARTQAFRSKDRREVSAKNGMRNRDMRIVWSLMDGFFLISVNSSNRGCLRNNSVANRAILLYSKTCSPPRLIKRRKRKRKEKEKEENGPHPGTPKPQRSAQILCQFPNI